MNEQTPLYLHSGEYAFKHGEIKQYHASYQANVACKEAIEQAIGSHYKNNRLDAGCADRVIEHFGYDRVFYVLANTVQHKGWDGRISRENKAWAKTIPVALEYGSSRNAYFVVDRGNPGLTDLFLSIVRKNYEREKKPSVRENLKQKSGQAQSIKRDKILHGPER